MKNLIQISHNQPKVSSLDIALGVQIQHKNILALIRKNISDFEPFGEMAFETLFNNQGKPTEYCLLNERQATLLFTYMRNKPLVKRFKIALVKQFYEMSLANKEKIQRIGVLENELLQAKPRWKKIIYYKELGLKNFEIARILQISKDTMRKDLRLMENCGLIEPPQNLAQLQQLALPLIEGGANTPRAAKAVHPSVEGTNPLLLIREV